MSTFTETLTQTQPAMMIRLRRLSKSAFISESNSKSPRLDKMIAHVNLFDKITQRMEQDMEERRDVKPVVHQVKKSHVRPQIVRRTTEEQALSTTPQESTVTWNEQGVTAKPQENCVYITEVHQVEDLDDDY